MPITRIKLRTKLGSDVISSELYNREIIFGNNEKILYIKDYDATVHSFMPVDDTAMTDKNTWSADKINAAIISGGGGGGGSTIDDGAKALDTTWSSSYISDQILALIDDGATSTTYTWSSDKIDSEIDSRITTGLSTIDLTDLINDATTSSSLTWSSNKIDSEIDTRISSAISGISLTDLINDATTSTSLTWSSDKIDSEISSAFSSIDLSLIINDGITSFSYTWSSDKITSEISTAVAAVDLTALINDSISSLILTWSSDKIDGEIDSRISTAISSIDFTVIINDATTSSSLTWSSTKIDSEISSAVGAIDLTDLIDDGTTSSSLTWSSTKISSEISSAIGAIDFTVIIDDGTTSTSLTWSSNKISSMIAAIDLTDLINDATTSSILTWSSTKIASEISSAVGAIDLTDLIDDGTTASNLTWSSSKISSTISAAISGIDWQESVITRWDPSAHSNALPSGPSTGDRYLAAGTLSPWTTKRIYVWSGSAWTEIIPTEGAALWVEDENVNYVYNGTNWVTLNSIVNHNTLSTLQGGTTNEYYHLTSALYTFYTSGGSSGHVIRWSGSAWESGAVTGAYIATTSDLTIKSLIVSDTNFSQVISRSSNNTAGVRTGGYLSQGVNSTPANVTYAAWYGKSDTLTASSEDGSFVIYTMRAGTLTSATTIDKSGNLSTAGLLSASGSGSHVFGATAGAASTYLDIYTAAGYYRAIRVLTGTTRRWVFGGTSGAESTGDAGTPFAIEAYDDTGVFIDTPFSITRVSGGNVAVTRPLYVSNRAAVGSGTSISTSITLNVRESYTNTTGDRYGTCTVLSVTPTGTTSGQYFSNYTQLTINAAQTMSAYLAADYNIVHANAAATVTRAHGYFSSLSKSAAATISDWRSFYAFMTGSGTTVTTAYGMYIENMGAGTNNYGLYIADITGGATLNYSIYTGTATVRFGGDLLVVGATASAGLTIGETTSAVNKYLLLNSAANKEVGIGWQSAGTANWYLYRPVSSTDLRLYNGSADVITIASTGQTTWSTNTTPCVILQGNTNGNQGIRIQVPGPTNTGKPFVEFRRSGDSSTWNIWRNPNSTATNDQLYFAFGSPSTSPMFSIDPNGNIAATGNCSVATGKVYQINSVQIGLSLGMSDVTITSAAAHNILAHDGTNWKNKTPAKKTIVLSAAGGYPETTAGSTVPAVTEATTNKGNYWTSTFAESAIKSIFWNIVIPDDYNTGLEFAVIWTTGSGSGNVRWEIAGRSYADNEALDQALSAYTGVTDTILTVNYVHITSFTSYTPTSVGADKYTILKVRRNSSDALDTSTATDVKILGVILRYTPNAY